MKENMQTNQVLLTITRKQIITLLDKMELGHHMGNYKDYDTEHLKLNLFNEATIEEITLMLNNQ